LRKRPPHSDFRVLPGALMLSRYRGEKILAQKFRVALKEKLRRHEGLPGRRCDLSSKIDAGKLF
jgi:hypothetical protein